jgi:hypothetical protein
LPDFSHSIKSLIPSSERHHSAVGGNLEVRAKDFFDTLHIQITAHTVTRDDDQVRLGFEITSSITASALECRSLEYFRECRSAGGF